MDSGLAASRRSGMTKDSPHRVDPDDGDADFILDQRERVLFFYGAFISYSRSRRTPAALTKFIFISVNGFYFLLLRNLFFIRAPRVYLI
jgi:hypothetical protein